MKTVYFRSLWISDTHLGGRNLQSGKLLQFLKATDSEYLYLVGDIFDLWKLRARWFWPEINNLIVAEIIKKARNGTSVYYIPGNHDDIVRSYCGSEVNGISVRREIVHLAADGRRYLVLHGDEFDCVVQHRKWLAALGSRLYDLLLVCNRVYNRIRRYTGKPYHSISAAVKHRVKQAVNYIGNFEQSVVCEAKLKQVDGLICGHIHHAAIRDINGVLYSNAGDWVESCTALAENKNGTLGIINWQQPLPAEELVLQDACKENRYSDGCLAPTN